MATVTPRSSPVSTGHFGQTPFLRGILKSPDSRKSTRVHLPEEMTSARSDNSDVMKKTAFVVEESPKDRENQLSAENRARLLRYRRWSNPENSLTSKRKDKTGTHKRLKAQASSVQFFNPYEFYVNKFNDNNALITDSRKARLRPDSRLEGERKSLRRGYHSRTSSSRTESMITEWMHDTSKNRQRYFDFREAMGVERDIFSAGTLSLSMSMSKSSLTFPHDSRETTLSRRESFLAKSSRRISLFGDVRSFASTPEGPRVRNFRWYSRVIKSVCGLKLEMQLLSMKRTQQANLSEILYISAGAQALPGNANAEGGDDNQFLLFDKSAYSRGRARSRMPLWAQHLMREPPNRRPNEMVHRLRQVMMNMKSFRENITENMRHTVCKVVRYTKCDKGRVVLRQGHWGFDFYFIFSGSVFIQLELLDERTGQTYPSVENVLKSGEGFGEIAILGDGKRTASVICKEPTELCQIDRETFLEICPALYNELLQEKIQFASSFPIFNFWDSELLKKLCFLSQVLDVPHSTVLEEDWSKANFAYFVMKGRITLVKDFDATGIETASSQERSLGHVAKVTQSVLDKVKQTKHAKVGTLCHGNSTDLSILSIEPRNDIPRITLLSQGAKVLRVAVRTFLRMSPRKAVEEYLKKVYIPRVFPSQEELRVRFHMNISWAEFRKNVVMSRATKVTEKGSRPMANVPATLKGSTGWARWPGYQRKSKFEMAPKLGKERQATPSESSTIDWDILSEPESESVSGSDYEYEYEYEYETGGSMTSPYEDREFSASSMSTPRTPWLHEKKDSVKPRNDRSMTISPPNARTITTFKKGLRRPFDAKSL